MKIIELRTGESLKIGEDIAVTYVRRCRQGGRPVQAVRLGITAPRDIPVERRDSAGKLQRARKARPGAA